MGRIFRNPFVGFPLAVLLVMILGVAWSLTQPDRLVINQIFFVVMALVPFSAAAFAVYVAKAERSRLRLFVTWIVTGALGGIAAFAVFFASGIVIPYDAQQVYNYPHFHYAHYARGGAEQRVFAGDQAIEETLYTLDGDPVSLTGLWQQKPIVVEFGSIT